MSNAPTTTSVGTGDPVAHDGPGPEHLADVLAAAVLATDGVAGLHSGRFGEVGTYLPGRRVDGVRLSDRAVEVHVVVHPRSLPGVGDAVRGAVAPRVDGRPVHVLVADVVDPRTPADRTPDQPAEPLPTDLTDRTTGHEERTS